MARSMGYQYETSPRKLEPEYIPVRKKAKKQSNKQQKNSKKYFGRTDILTTLEVPDCSGDCPFRSLLHQVNKFEPDKDK